MSYNTYHNQKLLRKIPQFESLDHDELSLIISDEKNGVEEFAARQIIVHEKDKADYIYLILEGHVEVYIQDGPGGREIPLTTLHVGDTFGEQYSQTGHMGVRSASVRALHPCKLLKIAHTFIKDYANKHKHVFSSLEQELLDLLKPMRLFQALTDKEFESISSWAEIEFYKAGELVFRELEKAEHFYIVLDGLIEQFILDDDDKINILGRFDRRAYFGDHALLPGQSQHYHYYARCDMQSQIIKVPAAIFNIIMTRDQALLNELKIISERLKHNIDSLK